MDKEIKNKRLILRVNEQIAIYGNTHEYVVEVGKENNITRWYLSDLQMCFEEIYEYILKNRLMFNKKKDCDNIIKIINKTRKEIRDYWKGATKNFEIRKNH